MPITNPKITVLMTVYNSENYLQTAIESILNQTFANFEFLIINDGSTQNINQIISLYHDPRIRFINQIKNIGRVESLNKGLLLARGDYIALQDADDISLPVRLEKEISLLLRNPSVALTGTFFSIINEENIIITTERLPTDPKIIKKVIVNKNVFANGSILFRKECLTQIGYYRKEFRNCEDYDFLLRVSEKFEVTNVPDYLYQWRLHRSSFSATNRYAQNLAAQLAKKMHKQREEKGIDDIQRGMFHGDISADIPSEIHNVKSFQRDLIIESYHFELNALLYNGEKRNLFAPWIKALSYSHLNLKTWFLLFLILARIITPRKIFYHFLFCIYKMRYWIVNLQINY